MKKMQIQTPKNKPEDDVQDVITLLQTIAEKIGFKLNNGEEE